MTASSADEVSRFFGARGRKRGGRERARGAGEGGERGAEHAQILDAIAEGDEAGAVAAVSEHIRETEQILLQMLERDEERSAPVA